MVPCGCLWLLGLSGCLCLPVAAWGAWLPVVACGCLGRLDVCGCMWLLGLRGGLSLPVAAWCHGLWRGSLHSRRFSACYGSFLDSRVFSASERWCSSACRSRARPCSSASCPALKPRGLKNKWPIRQVSLNDTGLLAVARVRPNCCAVCACDRKVHS